MGVYLFADQSLSWLPPLVFTAMNEAGVAIRLSMLSLAIFWIIALCLLQCMGSYNIVIEKVTYEVTDVSVGFQQTIETPTLNEELNGSDVH